VNKGAEGVCLKVEDKNPTLNYIRENEKKKREKRLKVQKTKEGGAGPKCKSQAKRSPSKQRPGVPKQLKKERWSRSEAQNKRRGK